MNQNFNSTATSVPVLLLNVLKATRTNCVPAFSLCVCMRVFVCVCARAFACVCASVLTVFVCLCVCVSASVCARASVRAGAWAVGVRIEEMSCRHLHRGTSHRAAGAGVVQAQASDFEESPENIRNRSKTLRRQSCNDTHSFRCLSDPGAQKCGIDRKQLRSVSRDPDACRRHHPHDHLERFSAHTSV